MKNYITAGAIILLDALALVAIFNPAPIRAADVYVAAALVTIALVYKKGDAAT